MSAPVTVRASLAPRTSVLLVSQLVFNLGFYAVVPFLAATLRDDLLLTGTAVGLVLGARTFFQQGLFLAGGILADRYGARSTIAAGVAVRVAGYLLLAASDGFTGFLIGAALTGLGGALFSPALETLIAAADARTRSDRPAGRPSLFAALVVVGEVGAAAGPLAGALLLGLGFAATVLSAATVFAAVGVVLWFLVPGGRAEEPSRPAPVDAWGSLRNRRFAAFAAFFGVNLLAYNQLYLGLSFEVDRIGGGAGTLSALFLVVSLLTIALQWPVAALARRIRPGRALPLGFALMACGFTVVAAAPRVAALDRVAVLPAVLLVVCLALGHMLVVPVAFDLVPLFAGPARLGSYYGLLATCGGIAVLLGSALLGGLLDTAPTPAWASLAAVALLTAAVLPRLLPPRTIHPDPSTDEDP